MISICGGEPLIYPHIEPLVEGLLEQGRIVYICTNGVLHAQKDARISRPEPGLDERRRHLGGGKAAGLAFRGTDQAGGSGKNPHWLPRKAPTKPTIGPSAYMYWNVHLDGLERTHDLIVEREGVFKECVAAMRMAKVLDYRVATNTTIYKETDMAEIEQMYDYLSWLGVDGHTISPATTTIPPRRTCASV